MIFILGISLGVTALTLRSPAIIAGVGLAIVAAFGLATALLGVLHVAPLLFALGGYNVGIFAGFVAMMTVQKFRVSMNVPH
ncbi:hypothetical protein G6L28_16725 [Agrobacterium larrymoorei]|uniref:hypothetical protein n=1 Tax=Agrobacterium larrymoorei TaxID=160699 RepID=UPI00157318AE|nr:hypothetical protein [Agrobacterium larrymoorei]NTJ44246.1 hypothetical protein [Agrobacterium larrymoorei]